MEIRWGWITNVIRSFWKLSKHTLYDAWIVLCKKCFVFNIIVNLWLYTTSIAFWGKELQQIERNLPYITIWIHGCPSKSRYFGPWNVLEVKWPSAVAKHGNLVVVWVAFKATFKKRKLGTHTLVYWPTWKVTSKRAEEAILPHLWGEKEVLKLKRMHYGFPGCTMGSEDVIWVPRMYYGFPGCTTHLKGNMKDAERGQLKLGGLTHFLILRRWKLSIIGLLPKASLMQEQFIEWSWSQSIIDGSTHQREFWMAAWPLMPVVKRYSDQYLSHS